MKITIEVSEVVYGFLEVLAKAEEATVEDVVGELVDHAQQGVYRPGAWERQWLMQVFGEDFTRYLEPGDPYGREGAESIFQRPKKSTAEGFIVTKGH